MRTLDFDRTDRPAYRLLCLGAHCDDIEIGCGGTLLRLIEAGRVQAVRWVVFASTPQRAAEATASAQDYLREVPDHQIIVKDYRDGFLAQSAFAIKEEFEALKAAFDPDVVFTHTKEDHHQDHHLLADLTWNTFRNHLVLEYEIPKYDGDLGNPNFFVHLQPHHVRQKAARLLAHFASQAGKHWFDEETFVALPRLRGMQSAAPSRYAEAFTCRKLVL